MSTWTNEQHDKARQLAADYDHPREVSFMASDIPPWERLAITLSDALDEIERLRDENANLTARAEAAEKRASNAAWARDYDHQGGI